MVTSDGTSGTHTTDSNLLLTFPSGAGEYDIEITGIFPRIYHSTWPVDGDKIIELKQIGTIEWESMSEAFSGCENMVITATDSPNLSQVTDYTTAFQDCSSLTSFPAWDVSAGENFISTWSGCTNLVSFPRLYYANAPTLVGTWVNCASLESWSGTTSENLVSLNGAWFGCTDLVNFSYIETKNVTNMNVAWGACPNLVFAAALDLRSLENGTDMLDSSEIDTTIWSDMLIGADDNNSNIGVTLNGGSSKHNTAGGTAESNLEGAPRNWTIDDGGAA